MRQERGLRSQAKQQRQCGYRPRTVLNVWKLFAVALVVIVAATALAVFAQVASVGASDSCNGCDTSPAWAKVVLAAAGPALVVWLVAAVAVGGRALVRARRAS